MFFLFRHDTQLPFPPDEQFQALRSYIKQENSHMESRVHAESKSVIILLALLQALASLGIVLYIKRRTPPPAQGYALFDSQTSLPTCV
jgi:hypothetical protein